MCRYYLDRKGFFRFRRHRWPKLTVVTVSSTHLIARAHVGWGPSQDSPQFRPAVCGSATVLQWDLLMGDAAYNAEHNHVLCRQNLGIRQTVIPINPRRSRKWPRGRYHRQMKKRFFKRLFRNRRHVELSFDELKTHHGSTAQGALKIPFRSHTPRNVMQEAYALAPPITSCEGRLPGRPQATGSIQTKFALLEATAPSCTRFLECREPSS